MTEDVDAPHPSDRDRYAWYVVRNDMHKRLCETSLSGIGLALVTMLEEFEIERGDKVGLFDRKERKWLLNPWL